jgi:hypothetical protein
VTDRSYYSDRTGEARARDIDEVTEEAWRGLASLMRARMSQNWLAREFPITCSDGNGVVDTNYTNLRGLLLAHVPRASWPIDEDTMPSNEVVFDMVEFVARRVAKPSETTWHDYLRHHELSFNERQGRLEFRRDVNEVLARTGLAYELNENLQVSRLGKPEVRRTVADLRPDTGDATLDDLVSEARRRLVSRDPAEQRVALEKLWAAFERMKTIEPGADKKAQARALLDRVAPVGSRIRQELEDESKALTRIGNQMRIRHSETDREAVADKDVDYLFNRLGGFVLHVLRGTGRIRS